jgi:hypothetical protein
MANAAIPNTSLSPCDESALSCITDQQQPLATQPSPISPQQMDEWFGSSPFGLSGLSDSPPMIDYFICEGASLETGVYHDRVINDTGKKRSRGAVDIDPTERSEKGRWSGNDGEGDEKRKLTRGIR